MPVVAKCNARLRPVIDGALRAGQSVGLAAVVLLFGCSSLQDAVANGDTRTLSFHNLHTKEDLTVTYMREGRYDDEALKKIDWILRDWRRDEATKMDRRVINAVWELYRETGATEPIEIISGYRSPKTNSMLRKRGRGVARRSQHMRGRAIDLHIRGVPLAKQREAAMRLHRGGVGYYPSSKFIHVDVSRIRHWPRMTYKQLSRVFPDGRTVHVPSNGRRLPGYKLALADIARRGNTSSSRTALAAVRTGIGAAMPKPRPNLLASLVDGARDADEIDHSTGTASTPGAQQAGAPIEIASAGGFVPSPRRSPFRAAAAPEEPAAGAATTASTTPWPLRDDHAMDRVPLDLALAYAAVPVPRPGPSLERAAALSTSVVKRARPVAAAGPVTVVKKTYARLTSDTEANPPQRATVHTAVPVTAGMRFDDPWLRAAMFAPSLRTSMTTTFYGEPDYTKLRPLMFKPTATLVMTFSDDPNPGMTSERFSGGAVVFLATVTFQRKAALR